MKLLGCTLEVGQGLWQHLVHCELRKYFDVFDLEGLLLLPNLIDYPCLLL